MPLQKFTWKTGEITMEIRDPKWIKKNLCDAKIAFKNAKLLSLCITVLSSLKYVRAFVNYKLAFSDPLL